MKQGKAIGKAILPIANETMTYIEQELKKLAEHHNMWVTIDRHISDYLKYAEGGFSVMVYFKPKAFTEKTIRHPETKSRLRLLNLPNDTPYIVVDLTYNDSVIEGTNDRVNQYHFYVRTHGFIEIPYRHRNVEVFGGYTSFDYDTDIEQIVNSIKHSVSDIAEPYKPLLA